MPKITCPKAPEKPEAVPHNFKSSDIEKLNNELKKHNHHYSSPEELSIFLERYRDLLKSFGSNVDDDYRVIMHFLNGLGIYHNYCETWELFFEPPGYSWNK